MQTELPTTPACSNRPRAMPLSIKGPPRPPSRAGLFSPLSSACGPFVFQRIDDCPRLCADGAHPAAKVGPAVRSSPSVDVDPCHPADDSVRRDFPSLLKRFHGAFRARAEDTV